MRRFMGRVNGEVAEVDLARIVALTPPNLRRVSGATQAYQALAEAVQALQDPAMWRVMDREENEISAWWDISEVTEDEDRWRYSEIATDDLFATLFAKFGVILGFLANSASFLAGLRAIRSLTSEWSIPTSPQTIDDILALKGALDTTFALIRSDAEGS